MCHMTLSFATQMKTIRNVSDSDDNIQECVIRLNLFIFMVHFDLFNAMFNTIRPKFTVTFAIIVILIILCKSSMLSMLMAAKDTCWIANDMLYDY